MDRPRMTIQRWLFEVGGVAIFLLALSRAMGLFAVFLALELMLGPVSWRLLRGRRRAAAWCLGAVGIAASASVAAICTFHLSFAGVVLMIFVITLTTPLILGSGIAWAFAATGPAAEPWRSPDHAWVLILTLTLAPLTMLLFCWPLRLAFLASRPALDRLADRVAAGGTLSRPEWAGVYRVVDAGVEPVTGDIELVINTELGGKSRFIRLAPATPNMGPYGGLDFDEPLGWRWRYQNEH